ncbi:MAG: hypothetical protein JO214_19605 [Frankiaceae bacterium]|nr:hypothetical protein [Frankiaceae bacterium]
MTDGDLAQYVVSMAHDLRTPLTSIRGFADVLVRGADRLSDENRLDYLERIKAAAASLDEMITQLATTAGDAVPD